MPSPEKLYVRYCEAAINALSAQRDMTATIGHSHSAGMAREAILRDFLAAHLPEMTTPVSGVIFDADGGRSRQQDIVFVLKSFPRLPFSSGSDLIFVEGVVATVEIKSRISGHDWANISANIASVRALAPTRAGAATFGDVTWDETRIFCAVVTYGGSSLEATQRHLAAQPENTWPDVYMDLDSGMLVRNNGLLMPKSGDDVYAVIGGAGRGLAWFLAFLAKLTGRLVVRGVDWNGYLE